jgi:uncharacterized protein YbjT (DUF2867 family)
MEHRLVFVTGGTGYMGSRLLPVLLARGHRVRALARPGSARRLPPDLEIVLGDALDASSFAERVPPCDTFVQLVGVSHPSPTKHREFRSVDLAAALSGVEAARGASVRHFVYVSVAQPAPVMKAYVAARREGEQAVREAGFPSATILRPWYVVGPRHQWPRLLAPAYWVWEHVPSTRDTARRLGLVTLSQMVGALVRVVEEPPCGVRVVEVPELRGQRAGEDETPGKGAYP